MIRISFKTLSLWLAALACLPFGSLASAEAIQWVTVGDPGNTADTDPAGRGAVATSFRIMKYEFTNEQYTDFLNSVAKTDTYSLYKSDMNGFSGGITRSGSAGSYTYAVRPNMGDKPVNYVSWFDAARVSNWLMNGKAPSGTETGAYTLIGGQTSGNAPAVNADATFYIPREDQFYKAAYYKGGGTSAGYWNYATQSDTGPTRVTASGTGVGSAGSTGNFANFNYGASWNSGNNYTTTVGTNGGESAYGAFDMNGNVTEWNDLTGAAGSARQWRGGSWQDTSAIYMSSSVSNTFPASDETAYLGFRLASEVIAPVPEIDPAGMGSVLALVLGSLGLLERRRLKVA